METTCSHVLVVDDDVDMCNQLSDYLGRNDFHVTSVNTAKQMLDFIAHEAVDLLLLEPRLRGEDGPRLTRTVRESSSLPIVVVSGRDEVADRVMGLELGAVSALMFIRVGDPADDGFSASGASSKTEVTFALPGRLKPTLPATRP